MFKGIKEFMSKRLPLIGKALPVFAIILAGLAWPHFAHADVGGWLATAIGDIFLWIAGLIGQLTITLIGLLVDIAQFNNFIDAPAVVKGWQIVRDVCNMFFIVILLLIAFGSVFRIEEYQYKRILGKLLIMAVLINFSKSIAGFFIDIAQVVMLTFVNGFKEAAAGNFVNGFKIREMFTFAANQGSSEITPNTSEFMVAALLALITISITCIVVLIYVVVLLLRIIALWFLVIISPIAYALAAFPGDAKKYSSQWWDYFGKYATTGPILAFFLWLSLAVMQTTDTTSSFSVRDSEGGFNLISPSTTITQIGQSDVLLSFIINIILLMGGLWMTQQLGVAGGKLAGSASNKIQHVGAKIAKSPWSATKMMAKSANQSLVKATGGRVSFDVRDYAKTFKTARDDRRREAYQQFAGSKERFFKQWGTPTGAARFVLGGISRRKASAEANRLSEVDKELRTKLKSGHKGQIYRNELETEREELKTKIDARQKKIDKLADGSPLKQRLLEEHNKDKARKQRVDNLLTKGDKDLSNEYKDRINAAIRVNEHKMSGLQSKMMLPKMSSEDKLSAAQSQVDIEQEVVQRGLEATKSETKTVSNELAQEKKKLNEAKTPEARQQITESIKGLQKKLSDIESHRFKLESKASQLDSEQKGIKQGNSKTIDQVAMRALGSSILGNKKKDMEEDFAKREADKSKVGTDIETMETILKDKNLTEDEKKVMKAELETLKEKKELLEREQAELKEQQRKIDELIKMDPYAELNGVSAEIDKTNTELANKNIELAKARPDDRNEINRIKKEITELEIKKQGLDEKHKMSIENLDNIDYEKSKSFSNADEEMKDVLIAASTASSEWSKKYETLERDNTEQVQKRDTADLTASQAQEMQQQLQANKERMSKLRTAWYQTKEPADYYVERERRRNVGEELKKVTSENSDELLPEFEKAVNSKNESLAMALAMKLTNDANLNELMNHYNYKSNFEGLNQFRKEILEGQLGLDEQAALQYQNDLSFGAERVNHWDSARTVGYDVNTRRFYELSAKEHTEAALAEMLKIDNQVSARSFNRLAYGGESVTPDGVRKFEISDLGKQFLLTAQNGLTSVMNRFNINAAKNFSEPQNLAVLDELTQQGKLQTDILRQIKERGSIKPGKAKEK